MNYKIQDIEKVIQGIKFMDADGFVNTGRHLFKVSLGRREVMKCDTVLLNKEATKILQDELEKINYSIVA